MMDTQFLHLQQLLKLFKNKIYLIQDVYFSWSLMKKVAVKIWIIILQSYPKELVTMLNKFTFLIQELEIMKHFGSRHL